MHSVVHHPLIQLGVQKEAVHSVSHFEGQDISSKQKKDESGTFHHMATAHIKATVKGHEPIVFHTLCWRSKEICVCLCSVFQTIDLPQHLAQGPLLHNHDHPSVKTTESLQAAYRIIHKTIHQGQSILQPSITGILDSLRNRSRDQQRPQLPQGSSSLRG